MDESVRRRLTAAVASVAVLLGLLLAVLTASGGSALRWHADDGGRETAGRFRDTPPERVQRCGPDDPDDPGCGRLEDRERPDYTILIGVVLGLLGVLVLVGMFVLLRSGRTPRLRRRRRGAALGPPGEPLPDVAAAVHEDAAWQLAALREGTPRNAIVACWVRLEDTVMSAGVSVRGSDTSSELTARVLGRYGVDDEALRSLATLYREARFSEHEITEPMRERAVDALRTIHDTLRRQEPAGSGGERR